MFENASSLVSKVVIDSLKWSVKLGNSNVTEEDLLLALLENKTLLAEFISFEQVAEEMSLISRVNTQNIATGPLRFSERVKICMQRSQAIREKFQHENLFADHISLALLERGKSNIVQTLDTGGKLTNKLLTGLDASLKRRGYEQTVPKTEDGFLDVCSLLYRRDPEATQILLDRLKISVDDLQTN